ncbi:unnamed protein product [Cochlearia groenlandica]
MTQSSLLGELEVEVEIKAPAAKFYHMYAGRPHHVARATPRNVQACDLHDGEWGEVGSIIYWNYFHDGQAKVAKERIEEVVAEKRLIKYRVLEGDIMEEFKSFLITIQVITPKQGGNGSVLTPTKWHFEYEKIDENVSHPETLLPFFADMIKEIDEHLLSEE